MENYDQFSKSWRDEIDRAHGNRHTRQNKKIFKHQVNSLKLTSQESQGTNEVTDQAVKGSMTPQYQMQS